MEKTNEKPNLYIITGHRAAGKTTQIAALLPDHPFIPDVYQENRKLESIKAAYRQHDNEHQYNKDLSAAIDQTTTYINKQVKSQQNAYIEVGGEAFEPNYFREKTKGQYNHHYIFVMCDSPEISLDRLPTPKPPETYLDQSSQADMNTRITNYNLNKYAVSLQGRVDIFDGSSQRPKLLATIHDGKVIIASPKLLKKDWCQLPNSKLQHALDSYFQKPKKEMNMQKCSQPKKQEQPQNKRRRLGI